MTEDKIIYSTTKQQIEKLKKQGLIINDEESAYNWLQTYGYFNLIKSYREPYTVFSDNHKIFRSGVTFEQICSLYMFDKSLRNAVMASMLDLEEYLKAVTADVVGQSFGIHQDSYLQFRNYRDKKKSKYQFSLPGIMEKMQKALDTEKDPIAHYQQEHNIVPPWILFKSIYFSTIVNLINLMKPTQRHMMVSRLYSTQKLNISEDDSIFLMLDTLYICLEYRNIAAHGGRIYNYNPNSTLRFSEKMQHPVQGFSQLLFLLSLLNYQDPFEHISNALNSLLTTHCSNYPEDITYLNKILNINIVPREITWISSKSKKYHHDQHCSGMQNAKKISLNEAIEQGYVPCKKCT